MRGKDIQVGGVDIKNIEQGARVFGDVKIMSAGLFNIISSSNFLIKWDGGKYISNLSQCDKEDI